MATTGTPRPIRKARRPSVPGGTGQWSLGVICVITYLFVVHSFKINLAAASIAVGLFTVVVYERPLRIATPFMWMSAYLLWALALVPGSIDPAVSWAAWIESFKILLIGLLVLNTVRNKNQHRLITLAWLGLFALFPVRGTLLNFLTGQGSFGRYGWNFSFSNFNDMAALTLIPLGLSIERLQSSDKKWVKVCAGFGVLSLPFIVLITQSRGGMLGLSAMLLFLLARSRYRLQLLAGIAGVATLAVLFAPAAVFERIQKMSYLTSVSTLGESDSSAEQRFLIWQVAGAIIADNPVTGVGIGAYASAHRQYARTRADWSFARGGRDAHSTYLRVTAENGVIGLALFLMIFISGVREFAKTRRELKNSPSLEDRELSERCQAYQGAFIGLAVCAIFGGLQNQVFPFLLLALGLAAIRVQRSVGVSTAAPARVDVPPVKRTRFLGGRAIQDRVAGASATRGPGLGSHPGTGIPPHRRK